MPTDFRDGKTFPRRGREALGDFLWLARAFDKARAKAAGTHDGYIYPCPMDRAVLRRWGVNPREFIAALGQCQTDDQILAWLSARVTPDRMQAANAWMSRQKFALDLQDAQEGVPGAVAPSFRWLVVVLGLAIAALTWLFTLFVLRVLHA
jgi:Domain of unknown function (DUF5069)